MSRTTINDLRQLFYGLSTKDNLGMMNLIGDMINVMGDLEDRIEKLERKQEQEEMMIDRFKFRAWDIDTNRMLYDIEHDDFHKAVTSPNPLMQSTGLCDNTGTLIYEGDIVRLSNIGGKELVGIVNWSRSMWYWSTRTINYPVHNIMGTDIVYGRVLGNIHEHKHLIEEEIV